MSDRIELNDGELNEVVGGALVWSSEGVYAKDHPDIVFQFKDYRKCREYIQLYWKGGAQTLETLLMLKEAKLVW